MTRRLGDRKIALEITSGIKIRAGELHRPSSEAIEGCFAVVKRNSMRSKGNRVRNTLFAILGNESPKS